jgi:SAM-dependent methyltransferase
VCGDDDGDPIAVGQDFEGGVSNESFLVMSCNRCGSRYLSLRAAVDDQGIGRLRPAVSRRGGAHTGTDVPSVFGRHVSRLARALPGGARLLEVNCGGGSLLHQVLEATRGGLVIEGTEPDEELAERARASGLTVHSGDVRDLPLGADYDLVIFAGSLGAFDDPAEVLARAASMLRPGGSVAILTENASSLCARYFGGRHWRGYHVPRLWYFFNHPTLELAAGRAGLVVTRTRWLADGSQWTTSMHNLLADWEAPPFIRRRFASGAVLMPALFGVIDRLAAPQHASALLLAECRRV